ncbi:MAG TPA: pseudaminic acid synthase [Thermoplasmata archaeon]|nr:pseudaminic acid synthase [Thermoplasmata archaeon]
MTDSIEIAGRKIGHGHPVYIVAEMSANHNGSYENAVKIVHAAKAAGADAVKLQTYTPDGMTLDSDQEPFIIGPGTLWSGRRLHDLYKEAMTPWEWQPRLKKIADDIGIHLFSAPFDIEAVKFLEEMGVPAYKIASFEIVDIPLIRAVAKTGKPMIISTGLSKQEEIQEAVSAARAAGASQIALLKCTSAYPAPPEDMNLNAIPHMHSVFQVPVGLSDHTLGTTVPVAAVGLGACIVEKHLISSRSDGGPDSAFSLEPPEFKEMVDAIRVTEAAMGKVRYGPTLTEGASLGFRRSLFVVSDIAEGEYFTELNVRSIRPAGGLHPRELTSVIGRRAAMTIKRGTPLTWEHLK